MQFICPNPEMAIWLQNLVTDIYLSSGLSIALVNHPLDQQATM